MNGTFGGTGATWTTGDTITAAAGTTGQTFNINGLGTTGVLDVTSLTGNKVSGVQTVNLASGTDNFGDANQAFHGDFTATGHEGAWTGLTTLNVTSAGGSAGVDVVTVAGTTAVNITDTLFNDTSAALTVNGGSTDTIVENTSGFENNGGIAVNGVSGTTTVSVTQTETSFGDVGVVTITDVNGASTTAAGTITNVWLDGLSDKGTSVITDNALTTLTINNTDGNGSTVDITNNLTTPTNTTLALSLSHNGLDTDGAR